METTVTMNVEKDETREDESGEKNTDPETDPFNIHEKGTEGADPIIPGKGIEEILAEITGIGSNQENTGPNPHDPRRDRD